VVLGVCRIWLYREELPREKADSGLINSLVSFIVASSEAPRSLSKEVIFLFVTCSVVEPEPEP
jgi:hypothetical protein